MQTPFDTHRSANASPRRFDEKSQTWISFKSETDALFASFWLGEQLGDEPLVPITAISAILTLLKNPEFHAAQLSYDTGLDVLTNIAVNRHKTALTRSIVQKEGQIFNHSVIVDLVAQEIGKNGITIKERGSLKNMCLVHRSWTIPARRVLSRSAKVLGRAGLYNALRNPDFGPSTRLLYYSGKVDDRETRQLLSAVLKRCPGLRDLQLNSVFRYNDQQLLEDISSLQNLEKLELGLDDTHAEESSLLLMDVCLALPRMESLKSLTLYGVVCRLDEKFPSSLREISPCSRLTEVNLRCYYAEEESDKYAEDFPNTGYHRHDYSSASIDFISWIFKPRQDYKVTSTTVDARDMYEVGEENTSLNDLGDVLLSAFPGLQTLKVDTDVGGWVDYYKIDNLKSRFAKAKSEV